MAAIITITFFDIGFIIQFFQERMQTIILPGGSVKNKEWLEACASELKAEGIVRPVSWDHWLDDKEKFDPKEKGILISRHTRGESVSIVAKSIGCLVASYVILAIPSQIEKVIFNGIPLNDINSEEKETITKALSSIKKENIIIFQNESDPHGTYSEVKKLLPSTMNVVPKPRSDHDYPYYSDFNTFLNKL